MKNDMKNINQITYVTGYGRKIIRGSYKKNINHYITLFTTLTVSFLIGVLIGVLIFWAIGSL